MVAEEINVKPGTKKIGVYGMKYNYFIHAYLSLPQEMRAELDKVICLSLETNYPLRIEETKFSSEYLTE